MSGNPRRSLSTSPGSANASEDQPPARVGCLGALARVYWMAAGNAFLFFCAMYAARREAPSALDGLYAGLVASLAVVRWLDIARLGGQTAEGLPATLAHWRRYVLGLLPIAAGVWFLMRFAHANGWL